MVNITMSYFLGIFAAALIVFTLTVVIYVRFKRSVIFRELLKIWYLYILLNSVFFSLFIFLSNEGIFTDDALTGFLLMFVPFILTTIYILFFSPIFLQMDTLLTATKYSSKMKDGVYSDSFAPKKYNKGELKILTTSLESIRKNVVTQQSTIKRLGNEVDYLSRNLISEAEKMSNLFKEISSYVNQLDDSFTSQKYSFELLGSDIDVKQLLDLVDKIEKESIKLNKISDQTKIVALNASIEASQIEEESGSGFGIVADNVRELSERSNTSSEEIMVKVREFKVNLKSRLNSISSRTENITSNSNALETLIFDIINKVQEENRSLDRINSIIEQMKDSLLKESASLS
jgi:hypothetical protein